MGEEVNEQSLPVLIGADRHDEAVRLALQHRTAWVEEQLSYETLEQLEEQASTFLERWLRALPPFERLQAAEWAASNYVLSLVHLEHAHATGAKLLLSAQAAAAAALASTLRQVGMFADGPDAELDPSVEQRLQGYADQLDGMSFEFVPLEQ